jgi:hypothetical protein
MEYDRTKQSLEFSGSVFGEPLRGGRLKGRGLQSFLLLPVDPGGRRSGEHFSASGKQEETEKWRSAPTLTPIPRFAAFIATIFGHLTLGGQAESSVLGELRRVMLAKSSGQLVALP